MYAGLGSPFPVNGCVTLGEKDAFGDGSLLRFADSFLPVLVRKIAKTPNDQAR